VRRGLIAALRLEAEAGIPEAARTRPPEHLVYDAAMSRELGGPGWHPEMLVAIAGVAMASLAGGCAHQEREVVRLQPGVAVNLTDFDLHRQSLVLELQEGQVVPLDVVIDGDLAATPPGASVPVTIKRHCFLRVDDRGLRVSDDGQDFDGRNRVPGSFQLGIGMTREGTRATLRVTTPAR